MIYVAKLGQQRFTEKRTPLITPNFLSRGLCTCIKDSPFRVDEDFLVEDRGRELEHE